jgi:hypothetical protein
LSVSIRILRHRFHLFGPTLPHFVHTMPRSLFNSIPDGGFIGLHGFSHNSPPPSDWVPCGGAVETPSILKAVWITCVRKEFIGSKPYSGGILRL